MANYTTTLKDVANNSFLPETAIKMVFDDNNNSLSSSLTAADINVLEGGKINILSSSIASMSDYVTTEISDLSSVASGAASTAAWAASAATDAEGSLSGLNTAIASVANLASGNANDISALASNKATKVSSSANGNLAKFKADGDLEDTGIASTTIGQLQSSKADLSYVNGMKLTKIWENPLPTAEFTTSTIEFNESLQEVVIEYALSTDYPNFRSFLHIKSTTQFGLNPNLGLSACNLGGITDITFWIRGVSLYYSSESNKYVVSFSSTKRLDLSTSSPYVALQNRNRYIIPIAIYKVGDIYNS